MSLLGVWDTADGGLFVSVHGTNVVVHQQLLAGGGTEPLEDAGKMGTSGKDLGKEGRG